MRKLNMEVKTELGGNRSRQTEIKDATCKEHSMQRQTNVKNGDGCNTWYTWCPFAVPLFLVEN
jgi:hypothetical protein